MDKEKALDLMPTGDDFILIPKEIEVKDMKSFMREQFFKGRITVEDRVIHFKTDRFMELCGYISTLFDSGNPFMLGGTGGTQYCNIKYLKLGIEPYGVAFITEADTVAQKVVSFMPADLYSALRTWMSRNYNSITKNN